MKETLKEFAKPLILAAIVSGAMLIFIQPTIVRETSMLPTYEDGDYLIVSKTAYWKDKAPERGDVVIIRNHSPGAKLLIKRVVGLPGETVTFRGGAVCINGEKLEEPYLKKQNATYPEDISEYVLRDEEYFCMGDNREVSLDSRSDTVGVISEEDFLGKVVARLWPLTKR